MPYTNSYPVIFSERMEMGYWGTYELLASNGKYIRGAKGQVVDTVTKPHEIQVVHRTPDSHLSTIITDHLLCERIRTYMAKYYGQRKTNCSGFAHYLLTGDFQECQMEKNLLVAKHHMRNFDPSQKVEVGDMVCTVFAHEKNMQSRLHEQRSLYRKLRKVQHKKGNSIRRSLSTVSKVLSPDEILELNANYSTDGYHFMICVAFHNGLPVWLSQMGRQYFSTDHAYLIVTVGDENPYRLKNVLFSFIKKRK